MPMMYFSNLLVPYMADMDYLEEHNNIVVVLLLTAEKNLEIQTMECDWSLLHHLLCLGAVY